MLDRLIIKPVSRAPLVFYSQFSGTIEEVEQMAVKNRKVGPDENLRILELTHSQDVEIYDVHVPR